MIFTLSLRYGNTSSGSTLHVTEWEGEWWGWRGSDDGTPRERTVFGLDQGSMGSVGWGLKSGDARVSCRMRNWRRGRLIV